MDTRPTPTRADRRSHTSRWRSFAAAVLLGAAATATAEQPRRDLTIAPPPEVLEALPAVRLQGSATLRFLGMRIYEARLWVGPQFDAQRFDTQAFALELRYARGFPGTAIAQRSVDEMRRLGQFDDTQAERWRAEMARAFPDVTSGDRLTGVHLADGTSRFFHNGRATHAIDGRAFARLFFGIWLAPATSEPTLRRQLLEAGTS